MSDPFSNSCAGSASSQACHVSLPNGGTQTCIFGSALTRIPCLFRVQRRVQEERPSRGGVRHHKQGVVYAQGNQGRLVLRRGRFSGRGRLGGA